MTEPIRFWEEPPVDRELNAEIVRDVVREQFPELAAGSIEPMGEGWEHETYLVDGRVVFQFPRQAGGGDGFEWEERLHALVASFIGDMVGIPRITRWGRPSARFPYPFAGYDVIPGVAANDPSVPLNPALADDIGRVLARLHAIPADVASSTVGTADPDKADLVAGLRRVRYWVDHLPEIRALVPDRCAWLDGVRSVPDANRGPPRFIHDDFQMEHVLVDPTTGRLSGIIDWLGSGTLCGTSATCSSTAAGRSSSERSMSTTCRSTRTSPSARSSARSSARWIGSHIHSGAAGTRHGTWPPSYGCSSSSSRASRGHWRR